MWIFYQDLLWVFRILFGSSTVWVCLSGSILTSNSVPLFSNYHNLQFEVVLTIKKLTRPPHHHQIFLSRPFPVDCGSYSFVREQIGYSLHLTNEQCYTGRKHNEIRNSEIPATALSRVFIRGMIKCHGTLIQALRQILKLLKELAEFL